MRRRVWAASILVALAGCSSGSSSSPPTTVASTAPLATTTSTARTTVVTTTIPATSTTRPRPSTSTSAAPRTTLAATTTTTAPPVSTTEDPTATTITPDSSTTNVPAAPCDPVALLQAAEVAFGPLPAGTALTDPRCVENYASGVLAAPGQDNAFVVFDNFEGEWEGLNLGTDQICSAADVPIEFYGPLNCGPWEG